jgi:hypothetical protein
MNDVIEQVTSVHILDAISQSISTDGTTAMMVFMVGGGTEDAPPRKFAITFPTDKAKAMLNLFHEIVMLVERAKGSSKLLRFPMQWQVGTSPDLDQQAFKLADGVTEMPVGGKVMVSFDPGTPQELAFVMMNLAGLGLVEALNHHIMTRLTDEERHALRAMKQQAALQQQQAGGKLSTRH